VYANVLIVASECAPIVKTGGLGDVVAALPPALRLLGHDARLLIPGYPAVLHAFGDAEPIGAIDAVAGLPAARILASRLGDVTVYVVACNDLYDRPAGPYQDEHGIDWPDNARRFALLSRVGAAIGSAADVVGWKPDVVHAHDWQAGLAPAYLQWSAGPRAASLITIHNLAFKGIFDPSGLHELAIPPQAFSMHGVEYHGKLSFLKAGVYYADAIGTVSPGYASEIQSAPLGMGFEGLLAARSGDLHGILNGIDDAVWNPRTDRSIASRYSAKSLWRKAANKRALQQRFGLPQRSDVPLLGLVGRLTEQKGIDLVLAVSDELLAGRAQLVVLGTGERKLEAAVRALPERHPGAAGARIGFDEALAHAIEAGADAFLMPSLFEPCGMNQMYSQRYGTPPIVHATGGLRDSVVDCRPETLADGTATGFVFDTPDADALGEAIRRCIAAWSDAPVWKKLQLNGMARDFGWSRAAAEYGRLYESLRERNGRPR
jgi:starch synthase